MRPSFAIHNIMHFQLRNFLPGRAHLIRAMGYNSIRTSELLAILQRYIGRSFIKRSIGCSPNISKCLVVNSLRPSRTLRYKWASRLARRKAPTEFAYVKEALSVVVARWSEY
jgi:hypothetical protein